jgi:integrase
VDLDPETVAMLRRWRVERAGLSLQLAKDDALVFGNLEGGHLHPERFSARFAEKLAQCQRALGREAPPAIRLHDIRHVHATLLLQAGVPVKVVSERLGYATVMITLETYAHVMPGMQSEAAATFARLMSGGGAS